MRLSVSAPTTSTVPATPLETSPAPVARANVNPPLLDAGPLGDPLVVGFDQRLEVGVAQHERRNGDSESDDLSGHDAPFGAPRRGLRTLHHRGEGSGWPRTTCG